MRWTAPLLVKAMYEAVLLFLWFILLLLLLELLLLLLLFRADMIMRGFGVAAYCCLLFAFNLREVRGPALCWLCELFRIVAVLVFDAWTDVGFGGLSIDVDDAKTPCQKRRMAYGNDYILPRWLPIEEKNVMGSTVSPARWRCLKNSIELEQMASLTQYDRRVQRTKQHR